MGMSNGSESETRSHLCVDCRVRSPVAETNYTLISSRHGWRLSRRSAPDGTTVMEWRCPACWQRFREKRTATDASASAAAGPFGAAPKARR
jgi:hypothetical protein